MTFFNKLGGYILSVSFYRKTKTGGFLVNISDRSKSIFEEYDMPDNGFLVSKSHVLSDKSYLNNTRLENND